MKEEDSNNHLKRYSVNPRDQNYTNSSQRVKLPSSSSSPYAQHVSNEYSDEEEDEDEEVEEDDSRDRYQRKRKWSSEEYEFAPRFVKKGNQSSNSEEWTEQTTWGLLDVWGDRFLELGRKSLRSEEWIEVANKVSQMTKTVRTDAQCRNRLDVLKRKYIKEKMKLEESGGGSSKWVYFKKMDMLMSLSSRQQCGLACGLDSGEYVFMDTNVYLNCANKLDEMRDSPESSESSEGLPPKEVRGRENGDEGNSFKLLADSIQKFGEIYERIEESKRQQMRELEKMRLEFHRDLELQKRQILEHAQAEIAKIQQEDDDDGDKDEINVSVGNLSE
ncbi:Trihelix transcription factor asil1 [Thalictrum thalictroides]|uniref:Trihelix transcription factor asil1 n=1 Tax=Thalictrum thalictroides TaxID=46969 RepID=A0A7J6V9Y5_THATH|nr:Trihelix transcription factor asil1 [Thalictrum thalictroides]